MMSATVMSRELWNMLNNKMIEYMDSVTLQSLVDEQVAKGVVVDERPVRRAISAQPVLKPVRTTAPNSVFAFGSSFSSK